MKIVLLKVPMGHHIQADMSDLFDDEVGVYPPLGLLYIYASHRKLRPQDDLRILDCVVEKLGKEEMIQRLTELQPDLIGITVLTFHLIEINHCIALIKNFLPQTRIVLGGPHVHLFPVEALKSSQADYAVTGEGEHSFPQLIECMEQQTPVSDVPGIYYYDAQKTICRGKPAEVIVNLDQLPLLDFNAIPVKRYSSLMSQHATGMLMTSRGCPFQCIYCDRPTMGNDYRVHSPERVIADLKAGLTHGIHDFQIWDDTFTVQRKRVLAICQLIQQEQLNLKFSIRARVNTIDEEVLQQLKLAGCARISFGVEAGSEKMLRVLKKGINMQQVFKAFELAKKYKIDTLADFIIGGPDQKREDCLDTINLAIKLDPTYVQFTIMTPFPGTELYAMALERGIVTHDIWKQFAENPNSDFETPLWEEHLSREELMQLFTLAYKRFYRRPKLILREILKVRSFREFIAKAKVGIKTQLMPGAH
ncbi:radical SAM protein [Deltaproteobacteria bacterium TL4]